MKTAIRNSKRQSSENSKTKGGKNVDDFYIYNNLYFDGDKLTEEQINTILSLYKPAEVPCKNGHLAPIRSYNNICTKCHKGFYWAHRKQIEWFEKHHADLQKREHLDDA